MKNGMWSENDFRLFSALKDYDDQKFINEKMGMDDDDMISRDDYINLLVEANAEEIRIQKNMKEKMEKLKKMKKNMNPDSLMPEEYGKISRYDRDSQRPEEYGSREEYEYIAPFTEEELSRPEVMEKMTKLRLFCYNLEQEYLEKERIKKIKEELGGLRKKIAIMELGEVGVKGIEREMMEETIESLREEERKLRMELGEDEVGVTEQKENEDEVTEQKENEVGVIQQKEDEVEEIEQKEKRNKEIKRRMKMWMKVKMKRRKDMKMKMRMSSQDSE